MLVLALDTCLGACSVAVYDASRDTVLASRREVMQRGQAEVLAPMAEAVLAEAKIAMADLARIAVTTGPGSFTGVRLGLSFAHGLGLALNIPVIGLDTMQATAAPHLGQDVCVVHAAGATGQNYVQHFGGDGQVQGEILLLRPDETQISSGTVLIGTGAASIIGGQRQPSYDLPDAAAFVKRASTLNATAMPRPLYIRDADAKPQAHAIFTEPVIEEVGGEAAPLLAVLYATSFYKAWPATDIAAMLAVPGTTGLLSRSDQTPHGFILARTIAGEAEILTICTAPKSRRHGIGNALLENLIERLRHGGTTSLFLEVAADNHSAISLYEKCGFIRSGLRKGYYQRRTGSCDAQAMHLDLA